MLAPINRDYFKINYCLATQAIAAKSEAIKIFFMVVAGDLAYQFANNLLVYIEWPLLGTVNQYYKSLNPLVSAIDRTYYEVRHDQKPWFRFHVALWYSFCAQNPKFEASYLCSAKEVKSTLLFTYIVCLLVTQLATYYAKWYNPEAFQKKYRLSPQLVPMRRRMSGIEARRMWGPGSLLLVSIVARVSLVLARKNIFPFVYIKRWA